MLDARSERGQTTVEWAGLATLIAVLMTTALGAWPAVAGEIPGSVTRGVVRALCVVRGGDCARDQQPCVVAGRQTRDAWRATIAFFDLGAGWTGLVERRSDGTVVVTRVREDVLGASIGLGAKAGITSDGAAFVAGGEARARLLATRGDALTWTLPDQTSADRLLERLRADRLASVSGSGIARLVIDGTVDLPEPDVGGRELGVAGRIELSGGAGVLSGRIDLGAAGAVGMRRLSAGGKIVYVRVGRDVAAALSAAVGGKAAELGGSASGAADDGLVLGVETDAQGRAVDLSMVRTGGLRVSADLPAELSAVAGRLGALGGDRRSWSVEHHLDLTVGSHGHAARAVLAALARARPDAAVAAAGDLGRLLAERGTVEARTYAVDDDEVGAGAKAQAGLGLGLEVSRSTSVTRLLAAATRGVDGAWREREDCLQAV